MAADAAGAAKMTPEDGALLMEAMADDFRPTHLCRAAMRKAETCASWSFIEWASMNGSHSEAAYMARLVLARKSYAIGADLCQFVCVDPHEAGAAVLEWMWRRGGCYRAEVMRQSDRICEIAFWHKRAYRAKGSNIPVLQWMAAKKLVDLASCRKHGCLPAALANGDHAALKWLREMGIGVEDYREHMPAVLCNIARGDAGMLEHMGTLPFRPADFAGAWASDVLGAILACGKPEVIAWVEKFAPDVFENLTGDFSCCSRALEYFCKKSIRLKRVSLPPGWAVKLMTECYFPGALPVLRMLPADEARRLSRSSKKNTIAAARQKNDVARLRWLFEIGHTRGEFRNAKAEEWWFKFMKEGRARAVVVLKAASRRAGIGLPHELWEFMIIPLLQEQ
jgi:hypothetical protein